MSAGEGHYVVDVSEPWRQAVVCLCGVIAMADHSRGVYASADATHVWPFASLARLGGSCASTDSEGRCCGQPRQAACHGQGGHVFELSPGVGCAESRVNSDEGAGEPQPVQDAPRREPIAILAPASTEPASGPQPAGLRAEMDARNAGDREARLRRRQLRQQNGETGIRGPRPRGA